MENLGNLEQAVNLFYKSQSNDQAQLNDFLISQQRDSQAWSWVWNFLDFSKSVEVQFFGAVTLHQKLSKNWQEVPQSMHNELKEKILQKIVEFGGDGTKLVLNRLCMSVSCLLPFSRFPVDFRLSFSAQRLYSSHAEGMAVGDKRRYQHV